MSQKIDELEKEVQAAQNDQDQVDAINRLAAEVRISDIRRSIDLYDKAIEIARSIGYKQGLAEGLLRNGFNNVHLTENEKADKALSESYDLFIELGDEEGQAACYSNIALVHLSYGDFTKSLEFGFKCMEAWDKLGQHEKLGVPMNNMAIVYERLGDYPKALDYYLKAQSQFVENQSVIHEANVLSNIGGVYISMENYPLAIEQFEKSLKRFKDLDHVYGKGEVYDGMGEIFYRQKKFEEAKDYFSKSLEIRVRMGNRAGEVKTLISLGKVERDTHNLDRAEEYLRRALKLSATFKNPESNADANKWLGILFSDKELFEVAKQHLAVALQSAEHSQVKKLVYEVHLAYSEIYKKMGELEKALYHHEIYHAIYEEVFNERSNDLIANLQVSNQLEAARRQTEKHKQSNTRLKKAMKNLKEAQAKMVTQEKLASLGQLMTGIAHEIQNPLNFIVNFSDISGEIGEELKLEFTKGTEDVSKLNFEEISELLNDLDANINKIQAHGRRADSIVKNMLIHSRETTSEKKQVKLNSLVHEYVQLAFHGMRGIDSTFKARFETDYDDAVVEIKAVPQDVCRVLLNVLNNAFYAVHEKRKQLLETGSDLVKEYDPLVKISTKRIKDNVKITIHDNGNGIPDEIREKIFTPFFTTKPSGQGTGLGLSMVFDIIVHEHRGEVKVNTEPGEFSEFNIILPIAPKDSPKNNT